MVLMIVFIEDFQTKIYSLIAMQVLRINYSYWIRSFNMIKDQIIEILNEIVYLVLIVLLTQYTDFDKWDKIATFVYIGIILSYTWVLLALSILMFIKAILGIGVVRRLLKRLKILRTKEKRSDNYKVDNDFGDPPNQNFSEISFSVKHKQDSFRVEKINSLDSIDDQTERKHTSCVF